MKLYLVRHGIATQHVGGQIANDGQRPLTEEGREETKKVAMGLQELGIKPDVIMSSPLVRTMQTAEILADALCSRKKIKECPPLAPGGNGDLFKALKEYENVGEVFLVGHEPDMGRLAASLIWAPPEVYIPFKKAGVCRIDITSVPPNQPGTLKWFITPKIATKLG